MLNFGLNYTDWRKIVWTFVQAALGVVLAGWIGLLRDSVAFDWEAVGIAALAAGISAVKNFMLADDSPLK